MSRAPFPAAPSVNRCLTPLREKGVGLLEVLIALVIAAFGVLGALAMMLNANRATNDAHYRTIATDIAVELADRMRANLPALGASDTGGAYITAAAPDCAAAPATRCAMAPAVGIDAVANCTPDQMAAFDLWQMSCVNGVRDLLPNGDFSVACADHDINGAAVTCAARLISVSWEGSLDDGADGVTVLMVPPPNEAESRK